MQFTADGPDVPVDVLRAQEEGRLVFFCGAGISMPAGLPSFEGLVSDVFQGLSATPSSAEQTELDAKTYDRVLGLLEGRFDPADVRAQVTKRLALGSDPPIASHQALLSLSRDRQGQLRLVTTNFDHLFEIADPSLVPTAAPLLPVPKPHKWNQLVYLHGRLDRADPDGVHLVLTSADFGTAYLVERWASRFVTELCQHFVVVFVGYSVNDPPMRYLVDALASERRHDARLQPAYALDGCAADAMPERKVEWEAKGIQPLLYDHVDTHARLHSTLKEWARIWSGGMTSRRSLVSDLAPRPPGTLPREQRSQFCWALDEGTGAMAAELARLGRDADIGWLDELDRVGLLDGSRDSCRCPLVDAGHATAQPVALDPVRRGIADWFATQLGEPALVKWVLKRGGRLHPDLVAIVRRALRDSDAIPEALRKVWLALSGSVRLHGGPDAYDRLGFHDRIGAEDYGAPMRAELLCALAPEIQIRGPLPPLLGGDVEDDETASRVGQFASFECELAAGQALRTLLEELRAREDWSEILCDLAFDLTHLLREALVFFAALDKASEAFDPSYVAQPSISPHDQNQHFHGWTMLIELVRDSYEALQAADSGLAAALVEYWCSLPLPLFRRLALHAFQMVGEGAAPRLLTLIESTPTLWLWSVPLERELYSTWSMLWGGLDPEQRERLVSLIAAGPAREMARDDLQDEEWDRFRDHSTWERLSRLRRAGAELGGAAADKLTALESDHPDWRLSGAEEEDFPFWMETDWEMPADFTGEELFALDDDALLKVLREHDSNREGLLSRWREGVAVHAKRALGLLLQMLREGGAPLDAVSQCLIGLREAGEVAEVQRDILAAVDALPQSLLDRLDVVHPATEALRSVSRTLPEELRASFLEVWDKIFERSTSLDAPFGSSRLTDALNHPVGVLAQILIELIPADAQTRGAGLPADLCARFDRVAGGEGEAAVLGRIILASRLGFLHNLDPDWAIRQLVPIFDWQESDEALTAWQGFLWAPWLNPSLWAVLKPHFIEGFDHSVELGEAVENLAGLLAAISIDGEDAPSPTEAADCLRGAGEDGRKSAAVWLQRRLMNAGAQASTLWRDAVGPWLASAWPREPVFRAPGSSEFLAWAACFAGDEFPNAAECVSSLVAPVDSARLVLKQLLEGDLVARWPRAALSLVDALTPTAPTGWFGDLGQFLDRVEEADPELATQRTFARLRDAAIRSRI